MIRWLAFTCIATLVIACGGKGGSGGDAGDSNNPDGNGATADAATPPQCTGGPVAGASQCSDCIDNDNDGKIDSLDIECTGPADDDEGSFRTGLPGDNSDPKHQDCFFDGDSGAGNDGCDIHTCCLLGFTTQAACNAAGFNGNYVPNDCPPPIGTKALSQQCIDTCGKATPPGCDCFGCCTVCDAQGCVTVVTNPVAAPNCTQETIHDPVKCPVCTQITSCGEPCNIFDDTSCVLCPGQDPNTLPPNCNGMNTCPSTSKVCSTDTECGSGAYCDVATKCCLSIIL